MIFHSLEFLLIYLPITLPLFFFVNRFHPKAGALFIFLASLFFYGWWNPKYTLLLLFSIMINFFIGMTIIKARKALSATNTKYILFIGVSFNLVVLGYFKYANFFAENMNVVLGTSVHLNYIILPLGISFFTFTQIAFLVDAHNSNIKEYNFIHYGMFVTFFPHLLAGPIYHHREMMPQFAESSIYRFSSKDFAVGLTIFFIGMFKKVCIADSMAVWRQLNVDQLS